MIWSQATVSWKGSTFSSRGTQGVIPEFPTRPLLSSWSPYLVSADPVKYRCSVWRIGGGQGGAQGWGRGVYRPRVAGGKAAYTSQTGRASGWWNGVWSVFGTPYVSANLLTLSKGGLFPNGEVSLGGRSLTNLPYPQSTTRTFLV